MKKFIYLFIIFFIFKSYSFAATVTIDLEVCIKEKLLKGIINIVSVRDEEIFIKKDDFQLLIDNKAFTYSREKGGYILNIKANEPVLASFIKNITNSIDTVSDDFVSIYSGIIPYVKNTEHTTLNIKLPKGFLSIVNEFDYRAPSKDNKSSTFIYDTMPEKIILNASSKYVVDIGKYGHVSIHTYVFQNNKELGGRLRNKAVEFISMYEKLLQTSFPYDNFIIAEDINPYGHAVPTMAVFGSSIINLPFIIDRSLGHEILHQWYGCAIDTSSKEGNWVEALTTYFADYSYDKNNQISYRKDILSTYQAYASYKPYPLDKFIGNFSKKDQSIGYGKGLMVIHQIKSIIGQDQFLKGIRQFTSDKLYSKASWQDLISYFDLPDDFYNVWIKNDKNITLKIKDVKVIDNMLNFNIERAGGDKLEYISCYIHKKSGEIERIKLAVHLGVSNVNLPLDISNIDKVYLDSEYDLMRSLTKQENIPAFYQITSSDNITFIGYKEDRNTFIRFFPNIKDTVLTHKLIAHHLKDKNVIISMYNTIPKEVLNIFKDILNLNFDIGKTTYLVVKNPFAKDDKYIMFTFNYSAETLNKLQHYGSYSYLTFKGVNIADKKKTITENGILIYPYIKESK